MSKTLAQHVREHALSKRGGYEFYFVARDDVFEVLVEHLSGKYSFMLTSNERVLFALFVACKLESEGVS